MNIITQIPCWYDRLPEELIQHNILLSNFMQQSSLTAAFRKMPAEFSVRLLHLGEITLPDTMREVLGLPEYNHLYMREVLLHLNQIPVVSAFSICSSHSVNWRSVLDCGNQPLGERLFDGSLPLKRSSFAFACPKFDEVSSLQPVCMRRSIFDWSGEWLWLGEIFLVPLLDFLKPSFE